MQLADEMTEAWKLASAWRGSQRGLQHPILQMMRLHGKKMIYLASMTTTFFALHPG